MNRDTAQTANEFRQLADAFEGGAKELYDLIGDFPLERIFVLRAVTKSLGDAFNAAIAIQTLKKASSEGGNGTMGNH